jgi:guanylate kinase
MKLRIPIIVIVGPSASGKTTLINELVREWHFSRVVTSTSRAPRAGEVDGHDYNFRTPEEFHQSGKGWAERALVHGNWYGIHVDDLRRAVSCEDAGGTARVADRAAVVAMDFHGAETMTEEFPGIGEVITVGLCPTPAFWKA